ncbi:tRNA pseudouridine(55) synthase TruB [Prochlorococcus sp. MIT 1341]|uniref:tRNA pseudouridine(55) synthase TruB n=1 Tax=Prochlorococcus sp. MIT 1341 TaxID=3096221 RepID=UPI002A75CAEC|nr:tRNA pseudouridine(55) synthase TruB [Prochlorococcus sp. MIT 1341]
MKEPFGFLNINKPTGITSHGCVSRIRHILGIKRVGHGGTLDPEVTGVLPIAVGKATRLLPYLPGEKTYQGEIQLGRKTTTDDMSGELIDQTDWPILDSELLEKYLNNFCGSIQQKPPQFSSVHIEGKRAHEIARSGKYMELSARDVTIHSLNLINWSQEKGLLEVFIHCSSGTYIRSLARDLGELIQCHGCLSRLQRIQALGLHISQSIELPEKGDLLTELHKKLIPPIELFGHMQRVKLTREQNNDWMNGRETSTTKRQVEEAPKQDSLNQGKSSSIIVLDPMNDVIGIGILEESAILKPKIVFNAK